MEYLDMVLMETLRLHPTLGAIPRSCVEDYKVPGMDWVIKKGQDIYIPVAGIHGDPKYYPQPEKFDPERFSKMEKEKRHP